MKIILAIPEVDGLPRPYQDEPGHKSPADLVHGHNSLRYRDMDLGMRLKQHDRQNHPRCGSRKTRHLPETRVRHLLSSRYERRGLDYGRTRSRPVASEEEESKSDANRRQKTASPKH